MPLIIKFKTEPNRDGDRLFITDITGEYNDPDNIGGYGSPNQDLNTLCLLAIIQYNHSEGVKFLDFIGSQFYYNASSINTDVNVFEANYINDGWHTMDLIALPVSSNKNQDINGNQLSDGDHFYYTFDNTIHKRTGQDESEQVDPNTVLDQASLEKTRCEDFFQSRLLRYREEQYAQYRRERSSVCVPNALFNENRELTEDIISTEFTFRSGLMVEAQDSVEIVLDEKNI